MHLISDIGEYQTKGRITWEHYTTTSPEKYHFFKEEGLSSLPEGEWAVAESQKGMTKDELKILCQGATPWKASIFLIGRVERGMTQRIRRMTRQTKKVGKESTNILFDET